MRSALPAMVLGLLLLLATPAASAHAAGSPPITQSGVIELAPVTNQTGSAYHANITNLGIPPGPGDTLRFSWSANAGDGPAIHFEIHSHSEPNNPATAQGERRGLPFAEKEAVKGLRRLPAGVLPA